MHGETVKLKKKTAKSSCSQVKYVCSVAVKTLDAVQTICISPFSSVCMRRAPIANLDASV